MRTYIHDPEFEVDFIDSDYEDEQMTLGDRLTMLNDEYINNINDNINNTDEGFICAFLRDLFDFYDESEQENNLYYMRESLYLIFKVLLTPGGREVLKNDTEFEDTCIWRADLCLRLIDDLKERNENYTQWEKTENAIIDFLNVIYNVRV